MTPELRAILDRFMYEQATVTHIVTSMAPGGADRVLDGSGWTVRQLVAHLARAQEGYAAAISRWLAGEQVEGSDFDPDRTNAETAKANAETPLPELLVRLRMSLRALFEAFHGIADERLDGPFGAYGALETFHAWERHYLDHGLDLLDAVPEVRYDPLVLNWILYAEFADERSKARQQHLMDDVRAHHAGMPDEEIEGEG
ncbi:MAG: maleylpyruvate isomerase N-terminal domain-containing protein [Dehalococcoidia bacterium]|nr:maleylpyruvate isomerase N-terminal domain-containing protein [Dehalococcoidia bacterium]